MNEIATRNRCLTYSTFDMWIDWKNCRKNYDDKWTESETISNQ